MLFFSRARFVALASLAFAGCANNLSEPADMSASPSIIHCIKRRLLERERENDAKAREDRLTAKPTCSRTAATITYTLPTTCKESLQRDEVEFFRHMRSDLKRTELLGLDQNPLNKPTGLFPSKANWVAVKYDQTTRFESKFAKVEAPYARDISFTFLFGQSEGKVYSGAFSAHASYTISYPSEFVSDKSDTELATICGELGDPQCVEFKKQRRFVRLLASGMSKFSGLQTIEEAQFLRDDLWNRWKSLALERNIETVLSPEKTAEIDMLSKLFDDPETHLSLDPSEDGDALLKHILMMNASHCEAAGKYLQSEPVVASAWAALDNACDAALNFAREQIVQ